MEKHFRECPICKSNAGFDTPASLMPELSNGSENYVQCKSCNAKWLLIKNEMRLVEAPKDPKTGSIVGSSLVGIGYLYDAWKNWDLESLKRRDEQSERASQEHELTKERRIQQSKEKINRLTVRFSEGDISEESYLSAVKTIEQRMDKLVNEKGVLKEQQIGGTAEPTALWYLVPFFFGILGGIVAYVGVKNDDQEMADRLLTFGFLWTFALVFFGWWLLVLR